MSVYDGYIDLRQKILYDQVSQTYGDNLGALAFESTTKGWALRGGTGTPVIFDSMPNINQIGTNDYSAVYAFKAKLPTYAGNPSVWGLNSALGGAALIGITLDNTGSLGCIEKDGSGNFNLSQYSGVVADGDWVIIHMRRKVGSFEFWVNGIEQTTFQFHSVLNHTGDNRLYFHGDQNTTNKDSSASLYWGWYNEYITDELIQEQVEIFQTAISAVTQCTIEAMTSSCRNPEYKFALRNSSQGTINLKYAPDGWIGGGATYERNKIYKSVLRAGTSTNELQFPKDGRDFIRDCYENDGVNSVISFSVIRYNKATFNYESFFTGKLDCSTYKIDELFVSIQVIDNSFTEKFKSRDDIEVDLYNLTTVDGMNLSSFANIEDLAIDLPEYRIYNTAKWIYSQVGGIYSNIAILPLQIDYSEIEYAVNVEAGTPMSINSAFLKDVNEVKIDIRIDAVGSLIRVLGATGNWTISLKLRRYTSVLLSTDETIYTSPVATTQNILFDIDITYPITVNGKEDYVLFWEATDDISTVDYGITGQGLKVYANTVQEEIPVKCMPVNETFHRISQIITDKVNPFYSDFFGQTDSEPTPYAANGELLAVINGLQIRDKSEGVYTKKTIVSFKKLFQSLDSVFSLGVGIENDKIVLETEDYFFNDNVIIDYSGIINPSKIEKEVLPDWIWNNISCGYNKSESQLSEGTKEINRKYNYANVINVIKNNLSLLSTVRGDTFGISKIRGIKDTKDTNNDYDNWLVDLYRSGVLDFKAREQEGFTDLSGDEIALASYNIRITPFRNIRRHYNKIKGSLLKNLGTYLRFLNSENEGIFTSRFTATETVPVVSNEDILIDDLQSPRWIPEKYIVEVPFSFANQKALEADLNGIIKLDTDKYGWILKVQTDNKNEKAEIELLRVNLNVVTPIEL